MGIRNIAALGVAQSFIAAMAMLASPAAHAGAASPKEAVLLVLDTGALSPAEGDTDTEPAEGLHLAETHYASGDGWWALVCSKGSCKLQAEALKVEFRPHPAYDAEDDLPGQFLRWTPQPPQGMEMLFKPQATDLIPRLKAGPVATWMTRASTCTSEDRKAGDVLQTVLDLGEGNTARLLPRLISRAAKPEEGDGDAVRVELRAYGKRQLLPDSYEWHMESGRPLKTCDYLQWAGDLDGDGRLDLLLNYTDYQWSSVLFLSSLAKPGELVGEAGRFVYRDPTSPGC